MVLSKRLAPASSEERVEALRVLFANLLSGSAGEDTDLRMKGYLVSLGNVSSEALKEAITAILEGTAGLENPRLVPLAPELAALCRRYDGRRRRELQLLECRAAKGRGEVAFIPSQEQRKKLAAGFAQLSESLGKTIEAIGSQRS